MIEAREITDTRSRYWFTADEHYGHEAMITFSNRPFKDVDEMDRKLIQNHNSLVDNSDVVYHLGDFTFRYGESVDEYISQLNGKHIFIEGNNDSWIKGSNIKTHKILKIKINEIKIVLHHELLFTWAGIEQGSWLLYGHEHGRFSFDGKRYDVGVDCNNYYPINFNELKKIFGV